MAPMDTRHSWRGLVRWRKIFILDVGLVVRQYHPALPSFLQFNGTVIIEKRTMLENYEQISQVEQAQALEKLPQRHLGLFSPRWCDEVSSSASGCVCGQKTII
jgi:hypothetical protein